MERRHAMETVKRTEKTAILLAILAASLYAISSPVSKLLLENVPPTMMAALLYLGAGFGLLMVGLIGKAARRGRKELPLTRKELPFTVAMVVLDIAAPIFLMLGLQMTTAANASLLNNFEIVATSLIALFVFRETISRRLWGAIILMTVASMILSIEDLSSLSFSFGSLFVLLACVSWGLENNCTRVLSSKDPLQIVVIKGLGSGFGSLVLALSLGQRVADIRYVLMALVLGFFAYGLSVFFYVHAQRTLGAAKTSTYYAVAPFIGVVLSLLIFRQLPSLTFMMALGLMLLGAYFASTSGKALPAEGM
jgi:drug/metabolite transporter (DMT)-like permease